MRKAHRAEYFDAIAAAHAPHDAVEVAEAVDGNHGRLVKRRREKGARHVSAMMLDVMDRDLLRMDDGGILKRGCDARDSDTVLRTGGEARPIAGMGQHAGNFFPQMCTRIARDRDMTQLAWIVALETRPRGERRKARPVLDAIEPLFLDGGHELAACKQGCGGI